MAFDNDIGLHGIVPIAKRSSGLGILRDIRRHQKQLEISFVFGGVCVMISYILAYIHTRV